MMEGLFTQSISTVSIAAALAAIVTSLISYVAQRRARKRILSITEEDKLDSVLRSDDIQQLGSYLERTLNNITVSQYSTDPEVAGRVDRYLEHIQNYVGTTEEVEQASEEVLHTITDEEPYDLTYAQAPQGLRSVLEELRTGETWNALARLRRYIEMTLRELAMQVGFDERTLRSAGQMVRLLRQGGYLDESTARSLEYAIAISNRAVHGLEVSEDEAWGAINEALHALRHLS